MVDSALTFNEHDIHLITKELQISPDNSPIKNTLFNNINIREILDSSKNKVLTKSDILLIIIILGNFKPKIDLKIKNTSKFFWLQVLKCKIFRVNIFQNKYNSSSLCKLWRKLYKVNMQKIYILISEHKNKINENKFLK